MNESEKKTFGHENTSPVKQRNGAVVVFELKITP